MGPGRSQQALSEQLSLLPSRVVAFVDNLEQRGYVERRRSTEDRRLNALYLTAKGTELMAEIGSSASPRGRNHRRAVPRATGSSRRDPHGNGSTPAADPGVHPGYKSIGRGPAGRSAAG